MDTPKLSSSEDLLLSAGAVKGTIGAIDVWQPTCVVCLKEGVVLQLWYTVTGKKKWRMLPRFESAAKVYDCYDIDV